MPYSTPTPTNPAYIAMDRLRKISHKFTSSKSSNIPYPEVPPLPKSFDRGLPPPPVKKTKSLHALKETKSRRDLKAEPLPPHPKPRLPPNKLCRRDINQQTPRMSDLPVFDIRPPSTIMGGPSNKPGHKSAYFIDDEDDPYVTQPFKATRELHKEVVPRHRQIVRNSVSASDVMKMTARPVSHVAIVEYAPPVMAPTQQQQQSRKPLGKKRELGGRLVPRVVHDGKGAQIVLFPSAGGR